MHCSRFGVRRLFLPTRPLSLCNVCVCSSLRCCWVHSARSPGAPRDPAERIQQQRRSSTDNTWLSNDLTPLGHLEEERAVERWRL